MFLDREHLKHRNIHKVFTHTWHFYTQLLARSHVLLLFFHTSAVARKRLHTENLYTQEFVTHTHTHTHVFYTNNFNAILHTGVFTHRSCYTHTRLHKGVFTDRSCDTHTHALTHRHIQMLLHISFDTQVPLQAETHAYTEMLSHGETFTKNSSFVGMCFYTLKFFFHKGVFTHRCVQKLLHTVFCTQMRLQTEAFTHRCIYMHRYLYTTKFLHTETFTRRIICIYWQEQWHTGAFNHRCLYTQNLFHKSLDT